MATLRLIAEDEAASPFADIRRAIDDVDELMIELMRARMELSERVQTARVVAGGPRLDLRRERIIFDRFCRHLGAEKGGHLARTILQICRGESPVADASLPGKRAAP